MVLRVGRRIKDISYYWANQNCIYISIMPWDSCGRISSNDQNGLEY